jgi:hypothetical protein
MIGVSYTLNFADYKAAQRLHVRQKLSRRVIYAFFYIAVPILAVLGSLYFIFGGLSETADLHSSFQIVLGVLIWLAIFVPLMRFINLRRGFKLIVPREYRNRNIEVEIDEQSVVSRVPGMSEGKFFWMAIVGYAQNEQITLLYVAKKRFLFIPTRAFSPEQRAELAALAVRYVVKR